jgi:hypothetical protein
MWGSVVAPPRRPPPTTSDDAMKGNLVRWTSPLPDPKRSMLEVSECLLAWTLPLYDCNPTLSHEDDEAAQKHQETYEASTASE